MGRGAFPMMPPLPNPIPKGLGPGEPYACDARDRRRIGERVPGRGGGRITGCAAPLAGQKGGAWVLDDGPGRISKARARDRRRDAARGPLVASDPIVVGAYIRAWERGEAPPAPLGKVLPHAPGRSRCDPEHPAWAGYEAAAARGELAPGYPRFDFWDELTAQCARQIKSQTRAGARGAVESSTRASARARSEAIGRGVDTTSAEYLDTLRPSSRAKALRRMGRLNEARDIERRERARKRARR